MIPMPDEQNLSGECKVRYIAYMRDRQPRQYTIRNIPESLDRTLRQRAKKSRKSFNQVAIEALMAGAGEVPVKRNLEGIAGTLSDNEAAAIEEEVRLQRSIDPEMWR